MVETARKKPRQFSGITKLEGNREAKNACPARQTPKLLSAANIKKLYKIQKIRQPLYFMSIEAAGLSPWIDELRHDRLAHGIQQIAAIAVHEFEQHFCHCHLQIIQQIGLKNWLFCFTCPGYTSNAVLAGYEKFAMTVKLRMKSNACLNCDVNVGIALPGPAQQRLNPYALAFQSFLGARKSARQSRKGSSLYNCFAQILEQQQIYPVFQPIIELQNGRIIGWEALSRGPARGFFHTPTALFNFAEEVGEAAELDHLCRCLAVKQASGLAEEKHLFINLHYQSLENLDYKMDEFLCAIAQNGLKNRQITLEISEKGGLFNNEPSGLLQKFAFLKEHGFCLALEHAGSANTALSVISQSRPEFIKLDATIVRDFATHPTNRAVAGSLLHLAEKTGGRVIGQGIEREADLSALTSMGVFGGQGFFFARPAQQLQTINPRVVVKPLQAADEHEGWRESSPIRDLVKPAARVDIHTMVSQVKKQQERNSPMQSMVITEAEKPVGLLMSYSLDSRLSSLYGPSLYYHRPVSTIMDPEPQIADSGETIEKVAKKAMNREAGKVYDDIIVTENGTLLGTVSVQDMMDALARVQVELAKGANPLTGLPGNVMIETEIHHRKAQKSPCSFLYMDLDNFKVYNDVYGFQKGDDILKMTAQIMKTAASLVGSGSDFIGHIGGDDFLLITEPERAQPLARTITQRFAEQIPAMYHAEDRERGYIPGVSRDGREGKFPLISISIGIIECTFAHPVSLEELSERAADVKKYAKSKTGNVYVKDRRPPVGSAPK